MDDQIREFLEPISLKWRSRRILDYPEYVQVLNKKYPSYELKYQIQFFMEGLESEPRCKWCNGVLNLPSKETCSYRCRVELNHHNNFYQQRNAKSRETCLNKWGVDNPNKLPEVRQKITQTCIEKYGAKVSPATANAAQHRATELNRKGRETLKNRYGVINPGQLSNHQEKCQATLMENHGVSSVADIPYIQEKREQYKWDKISKYSSDITLIEIADPSDDKKQAFSDPNQVIKFICNTCSTRNELPWETFKWRIANAGTPCSKCSNLHKGSTAENEIYNFTSQFGFEVVRNSRTLIPPQEIDLYCPEKQIAIEYNGLFWHHDLRVGKNYHLDKLIQCNNQGIRLIHVFEDEWVHRKSVVEHRLRHIFDQNTSRYYGRDTTVTEISTATAKNFIEDYHIQGYTPSSIKLGVYYKSELVGVMTFSKPTRAKGATSMTPNSWEISRACFSVPVIGGTSKLIRHFINNYPVDYLFTFADLRWGDGKSYEHAGMKFTGNTKPGYWYVRGNQRIHRYGLRKNHNDDPNLTEYENRLAQGYTRIWDCGHARYEWKK